MQRSNRWAKRTACVTMCLGLALVFHAAAQPPSPADLEKLLAHDIKLIQERLAKGMFDKKTPKQVKSTALMIAYYGHVLSQGKDKGAAMATLTKQAGLVFAAAAKGNAEEAKKLAADLSLTIKADPAVKPGGVFAPAKDATFDEVMRQFSSERVGGLALEMQNEELIDGKGPFDWDKVAILGGKIAIIGELAHAYPPEKEEGKKTRAAWTALAKDMTMAANALADAGRAKKEGEINKLALKLSDTCVKCHDIFR